MIFGQNTELNTKTLDKISLSENINPRQQIILEEMDNQLKIAKALKNRITEILQPIEDELQGVDMLKLSTAKGLSLYMDKLTIEDRQELNKHYKSLNILKEAYEMLLKEFNLTEKQLKKREKRKT